MKLMNVDWKMGAAVLGLMACSGVAVAAPGATIIPWAVGGSPIAVTPATERDVVSSSAAARIAARGIGSVHASKRYHVLFSDTAYPQRPLTHVSAWLVIYDAIPAGIVSKSSVPGRHFYVAVDAHTGGLIEAFTAPRFAWWNVGHYMDSEARRSVLQGVTCRRAPGLPAMRLSSIYRDGNFRAAGSQQFFRYAIFQAARYKFGPPHPGEQPVTQPVDLACWVIMDEATPQYAPAGRPSDPPKKGWGIVVKVLSAQSGSYLAGDGAISVDVGP